MYLKKNQGLTLSDKIYETHLFWKIFLYPLISVLGELGEFNPLIIYSKIMINKINVNFYFLYIRYQGLLINIFERPH